MITFLLLVYVHFQWIVVVLNWLLLKTFIVWFLRSIQPSTRVSHLVLVFCWKSKGPRAFSGAGYLPYLDTVLREHASSVSMSSSRSITRTLLALSMPPSRRLWFTLRVPLRLKWLQILPSAPWKLLGSVCRRSLALQEVYQMAFQCLWKLKAILVELRFAYFISVYSCLHFFVTLSNFPDCIKELFHSGADKFLVSTYFLLVVNCHINLNRFPFYFFTILCLCPLRINCWNKWYVSFEKVDFVLLRWSNLSCFSKGLPL